MEACKGAVRTAIICDNSFFLNSSAVPRSVDVVAVVVVDEAISLVCCLYREEATRPEQTTVNDCVLYY